MNESQHHRGPDEGGVHVEPGVGLGHRRLSIIDLATGQQPLFNEDGSVCVVFNGEIYNYQELIPELQALGHVFRTRSDTEVIVHAWEAWGERLRRRASAACSRSRSGTGTGETLFLARDRLGVKPLYYALLRDGTLLFGSELKSLLAHGGLDARHRSAARSRSTSRSATCPSRARSSRGASKLPPAHTLLIRRGQPLPRAARVLGRALHARQRRSRCADARAELDRRACAESVRLRMISEVPLGAFLSGGVDSSAVVAMMAGLSTDPVNTCSISLRRPEVRRNARSRSRWPTATTRATSSIASKATTST